MGVAWFLHPHVVLGPLSRAPGGFRQFDPFLVAADRILENRLLAVDLDFRHRRRLGFLVVWALVKKTHRVNPSLCCAARWDRERGAREVWSTMHLLAPGRLRSAHTCRRQIIEAPN